MQNVYQVGLTCLAQKGIPIYVIIMQDSESVNRIRLELYRFLETVLTFIQGFVKL